MDTITALSSARGAGLRGIIRVSGPRAIEMAKRRFRPRGGEPLEGFGMVDGELRIPEGDLVPCHLLVARAPRTYTGDDLVEVHAPGAGPLLDAVIDTFLGEGARLAAPGEFTRRAFECGRIDLTQVEAVLELIRASSEREVDGALERYRGRFGRAVHALRERLLGLAAQIEVQLDFSEEDLEVVTDEAVHEELRCAARELRGIRGARSPGGLPAASATAVLVGAPNAGKSSLFNALLRSERSVVADVEGTTLDAVEAELSLEDRLVHLVDAPGVAPRSTGDLESIAVTRLLDLLRQADLAVFVVDGSRPLPAFPDPFPAAMAGVPSVIALHQADRPAVLASAEIEGLLPDAPVVRTSASTGEGLPDLRRRIAKMLAEARGGDVAFAPNGRQAELLDRAQAAIGRALEAGSGHPFELVMLEIREAIRSLGEITGEAFTPSLVDRIFADFCIGK